MRQDTPLEDIDRLSERMQDIYGNRIKDQQTFMQSWRKDGLHLTNLSDETRNKIMERVLLFQSAKGKDLKRDRRTRAKTVTTSEQKYIKEGARKIDFEGVDTPQHRNFKLKAKRSLKFLAKSRTGRTVMASRETVTVRGKKQIRFRDIKGRFVKRI